jgi:uncharacterized protein (TIGR02246 family)
MTDSQYAKKRCDRNDPWLGWAAPLGGFALFSACSAGAQPDRAACSPANAPSKETSMNQDMTDIRRAETTWADSLKSGDPQRLATIIAPTFTFIGPDGQVENRQAYLAGYKQLPELGVKVNSIDMDEVDVRIFGDTAIVTGRVVAKLTMKDQPLTENVRFTRVYQRQSGTWLMVSGQGTRLGS